MFGYYRGNSDRKEKYEIIERRLYETKDLLEKFISDYESWADKNGVEVPGGKEA